MLNCDVYLMCFLTREDRRLKSVNSRCLSLFMSWRIEPLALGLGHFFEENCLEPGSVGPIVLFALWAVFRAV